MDYDINIEHEFDIPIYYFIHLLFIHLFFIARLQRPMLKMSIPWRIAYFRPVLQNSDDLHYHNPPTVWSSIIFSLDNRRFKESNCNWRIKQIFEKQKSYLLTT